MKHLILMISIFVLTACQTDRPINKFEKGQIVQTVMGNNPVQIINLHIFTSGVVYVGRGEDQEIHYYKEFELEQRGE